MDTPDPNYEEGRVILSPGDRVVFYSDGVGEAAAPDGEPFGHQGIVDALVEARCVGLEDMLACVMHRCDAFRSDMPAEDDASLLALEAGRRTATTFQGAGI